MFAALIILSTDSDQKIESLSHVMVGSSLCQGRLPDGWGIASSYCWPRLLMSGSKGMMGTSKFVQGKCEGTYSSQLRHLSFLTFFNLLLFFHAVPVINMETRKSVGLAQLIPWWTHIALDVHIKAKYWTLSLEKAILTLLPISNALSMYCQKPKTFFLFFI